jgi:hypothetical protein
LRKHTALKKESEYVFPFVLHCLFHIDNEERTNLSIDTTHDFVVGSSSCIVKGHAIFTPELIRGFTPHAKEHDLLVAKKGKRKSEIRLLSKKRLDTETATM